ncbi:MAG: hypothetical protein EOO07_01950 [Chitinophagaceae bacterium]|nr:MAG: hypothetical protein EOO07_01950 [Chitinophagaceae bacterium]
MAGCSSTKYIEDYQSIVKKVAIDSLDEAYQEQAFNYVQKDIRPSGGLGINVAIYNIFNTKDGKYKTSNISALGSPPPILDSALVEISRNQIEKYLKSKGFFMAKVKSEINIADKKAKLRFVANPGPAFFVNKLSYQIPDTNLKAIYLNKKATFTHLREGQQYDEDSLSYEREQIYQLMRQNGYYDFVRPYVSFSPDSNQNNSKVSIKLNIDNPIDSLATKHKVYTIGESHMVVAPDSEGFPENLNLDSLKREFRNFRGLTFMDMSGKFRRNPIVRYNFVREGETYDITKEKLTYDRLYELNVFKNVKIDYRKDPDSTSKLMPIITLIPQKRRNNRTEGEVPFNGGTIGFTVSNTYTDNNFLKGAERFQFQIKGGLQSRLSKNTSIFSDIYQRDFSLSASLSVPRLILPFTVPRMGKNGMPSTTFSTSYLYALQKDIAIRRVFINSITYDWVETKSKLHSLTPLNFEYRFGNVLIADTANLKDLYNLALLGRKDFTLGVKYAYSLNANKLLSNSSFVYFRGNIDLAGNLLQLATRTFGNAATNNEGKVLGLPFTQYVRPEIDIRWYKSLGTDRQFVARLNAGVGFAYGNSTNMPFEKLFFAGGSSGIRAWQARTLGPGNYNRSVLGTPALRSAFFGLDQLGDMRIESNLEYRYMLSRNFFGGKLKGATFVDMGNVWNLSNDEIQTNAKIDFKNLHRQIAIGTGLGLRYDVQFFVFRFDMGLKVKDPQFVGDDQWVIGKFFTGGRDFKRNYALTNGPDVYRFLQYNFGIGMPF